MSFRTNEEGYPFETSTDDKCFFSLKITDGFVMRCLAQLNKTVSSKIPCECGKVYIGETGTAMQERIKQHDRDIRLGRTQASAVSEHANEVGHLPIWKEVKFIDRNPHWYTRRVKEAIHIRRHE